MRRRAWSWNARSLGWLSGLALLLALPAAWLSYDEALPGAATDIALEHDRPLALHLARFASSGANIFDLSHTGTGVVALHLPGTWERMEVRGAALRDVVGEKRDLGYVRWTFPAGATVRFQAPNPGRVTLHNPSGVPVTVRTTTVRYPSDEREDDARIVTTDPYVLP